MDEPAPLIGIPQAPVPPNGAAEWFAGVRGSKLRAALFRPPGEPVGSVIVSSGRTEPIEKYFEVVGELQARGFVVLVNEWRGQGLSERPLKDRMKGHARGFADFVADYKLMLNAFEARLPKPWIAVSHSMGGCLTLKVLASGEPRLDAAIVTAPMLEIATGMPYQVARPLAFAADLVCGPSLVRVAETDPAKAPFQDNVLTHDLARFERNRAQIVACPDLRLGGVTWSWINSALAGIAELFRPGALDKITIPVTLVTAGDDKVVLTRGAKALAAKLPNGKYVEIAGAYHEILQEQDHIREIFWREFDLLAEKVGSLQRAGGAETSVV
jgi:lysophospholipase